MGGTPQEPEHGHGQNEEPAGQLITQSLYQELGAQARAFLIEDLSKDPHQQDALLWWSFEENRKPFDLLVPGVYFLLSFPASTASLERFFSTTGHAYSFKVSKEADVRLKALLRYNGGRLGCEGYHPPE